MKIEYNKERDLLYIWMGPEGTKAAKTRTISPGVHADYDYEDQLIGIEVLEAQEQIEGNLQFEVNVSSQTTGDNVEAV